MSRLSRFAIRAADLVRRCQRNLPCPLLSRAADLPPMPSRAQSGSDPEVLQLAILCQPKTFREALWSAWSWMRFLSDRARLVIGVDGEITPAMREAAGALFPGVEMIGPETFVEGLPMPGPEFAALARRHRFGRKLAFPYFVQRRGPMLFSDGDILVFRRPEFLLRQIEGGSRMVHAVDDARLVDPFIAARAAALGCRLAPGFNSGILYAAHAAMPEPLMRELLAGLPEGQAYWTMDQTFYAAVAASLAAVTLPTETYSSTFQGQYFWEPEIDYAPLVLRHFIGPVRHHFYRRGLPYLYRQARADSRRGA